MSGADAQRDVLNIRAIREGRALPVGNSKHNTSQATAAAVASAGERNTNLEQEYPNDQARVRERACGDLRVRQAEEISSAVIQRQLSSERVLQDCQQQIAELLELKERKERLLQADLEKLHKNQAELESQQPTTTIETSSQTTPPLSEVGRRWLRLSAGSGTQEPSVPTVPSQVEQVEQVDTTEKPVAKMLKNEKHKQKEQTKDKDFQK